jgi:hypothetical protein
MAWSSHFFGEKWLFLSTAPVIPVLNDLIA